MSFKTLGIVLIISVVLYGILMFTVRQRGNRFRRFEKRGMDIFEQEAHELEEQITEEAQKREQKRNKIGQLAKQKPERFAAALQKWLFKNSGT